MNNKKILVIHNESNFLTRLQNKLKISGYEVITASDGLKGVHQVSKEHPDLIILRSLLPHLDGWEVCSLIKRDFRYKEIPIVMVSVFTDKVLRDAKQERPDYILRGPFKIENLLTKIKELLSRYEAKREQTSMILKKQAEKRLKEYYKKYHIE